jgi:hypothetical protein
MKQGDKIKTIYGRIETVLRVDCCRVITYESSSDQSWYHPSKVWLVEKKLPTRATLS